MFSYIQMPGRKIRLGVCAMASKASSKPMMAILKRVTQFGEFEVIYFSEEVC